MSTFIDRWRRFRNWLDEANQRPANRAAALWFDAAVVYFVLLVLPIGTWIGSAWAARILMTATAVLGYSFFHSMYALEKAGGLMAWEAQFDE